MPGRGGTGADLRKGIQSVSVNIGSFLVSRGKHSLYWPTNWDSSNSQHASLKREVEAVQIGIHQSRKDGSLAILVYKYMFV